MTQLLSLRQAAERLQYSVRYLRARLAAHNIAPIGRGKAARITEADFAALSLATTSSRLGR